MATPHAEVVVGESAPPPPRPVSQAYIPCKVTPSLTPRCMAYMCPDTNTAHLSSASTDLGVFAPLRPVQLGLAHSHS